ncbi:MAG: hypothetical protein IJT42_05340 [Treponema sp.]|nr:hypothetical protein [Treponema sp.]
MKKFLTIFVALFCFAGFSFADEIEELTKGSTADLMKTQTIVPEEQHTTNRTAKVQINYTPLTDEAHIYYTCMAVSFDQGDAQDTTIACLQDFQKQNQYFNYKFLRKPDIKYYKDEKNIKRVVYHSYVQFTR